MIFTLKSLEVMYADVCNLFSTGSAKNTYAETDMEKDTQKANWTKS